MIEVAQNIGELSRLISYRKGIFPHQAGTVCAAKPVAGPESRDLPPLVAEKVAPKTGTHPSPQISVAPRKGAVVGHKAATIQPAHMLLMASQGDFAKHYASTKAKRRVRYAWPTFAFHLPPPGTGSCPVQEKTEMGRLKPPKKC